MSGSRTQASSGAASRSDSTAATTSRRVSGGRLIAMNSRTVLGSGSSQLDGGMREPVFARQREYAPPDILVAKPFVARLGGDDGEAVPGVNLACDAGVTKRRAERGWRHP